MNTVWVTRYNLKKCRVSSTFLLLAILLSSCSSSVNTRIMTFREEGLQLSPGRVKIEALEESLAGTQQFAYYAKGLAGKMADMGWTVVTDGQADYIAKLGFAVNRREAEGRGPDVYISTGFGFYRRAYGTGLLYSANSKDTEFEYERIVNIAIVRASSDLQEQPHSLLEISALSVGKCDSLPDIYSAMLDAIFGDPDRVSGSTAVVRIPLKERPCRTN